MHKQVGMSEKKNSKGEKVEYLEFLQVCKMLASMFVWVYFLEYTSVTKYVFFCTLICQSLYLFTLFGINNKSIKNTEANAYICPNFNPLQGNALKLHVTIISFHLSERGTP